MQDPAHGNGEVDVCMYVVYTTSILVCSSRTCVHKAMPHDCLRFRPPDGARTVIGPPHHLSDRQSGDGNPFGEMSLATDDVNLLTFSQNCSYTTTHTLSLFHAFEDGTLKATYVCSI